MMRSRLKVHRHKTRVQAPTLKTHESFGSVQGRVITISQHPAPHFILLDSLFNQPVVCHVEPGQEELLKSLWGQRVEVAGRLTRDDNRGRPLQVRHITAVEIVPTVDPMSFRAARGIFLWQPGDEPAEVTIRRIRDADDE